MKWLLLALFLPSSAFALEEVHEVAFTSATVNTIYLQPAAVITVSTAGATGVLDGAFAVEVYNLDSADVVNCGFGVNVSTQTSSAFYGREIRPRTGFTFQVNPTNIPVRCMTQDTTGTTQVTVTQIK